VENHTIISFIYPPQMGFLVPGLRWRMTARNRRQRRSFRAYRGWPLFCGVHLAGL
jgi:hypothetical protein